MRNYNTIEKLTSSFKRKEKIAKRSLSILSLLGIALIFILSTIFDILFLKSLVIAFCYLFLIVFLFSLWLALIDSDFQRECLKFIIKDIEFDVIYYTERKIEDSIIKKSRFYDFNRTNAHKYKIEKFGFIDGKIDSIGFICSDINISYKTKNSNVPNIVFNGKLFEIDFPNDEDYIIKGTLECYKFDNIEDEIYKNCCLIGKPNNNQILDKLIDLISRHYQSLGISFKDNKVYLSLYNQTNSLKISEVNSINNVKANTIKEFNCVNELINILNNKKKK